VIVLEDGIAIEIGFARVRFVIRSEVICSIVLIEAPGKVVVPGALLRLAGRGLILRLLFVHQILQPVEPVTGRRF
jgi:hypothetical protein